MTDWGAIAAIGGWVAVTVAFGAYLLQRKQMSFTANLDSLWRLEDKFNEDEMVTKRSTVARRLLDKETTPDRPTEDILDYFDMIGYLTDQKALDRRTAWMMFSDAALSYWYGAQPYLEANGGGEYWGDFKSLITDVFVPIEMKKGKIDASEFEDRAIKRSHEFLACEAELASSPLTRRTVTSASSGRAQLGRTPREPQPQPVAPAASRSQT